MKPDFESAVSELQRVWMKYVASARISRTAAKQHLWPEVLDAIYTAWTYHDLSFHQIARSMGIRTEQVGEALRSAYAVRERKSVQRAYEAGRSSVIPVRRSA